MHTELIGDPLGRPPADAKSCLASTADALPLTVR
jgi:hypothetical protein